MSKDKTTYFDWYTQDSGHEDWYTPADIIEAVRATMGGIDLDPASSDEANEVVKAGLYYTIKHNSLQPDIVWSGRVWLNPPFSMVKPFVKKLLTAYEDGSVQQACIITYASVDTEWGRMLMQFPHWYPVGRVNYRLDRATAEQRERDGVKKSGAKKPSMVTYIGLHVAKFASTFTTRLGGQVDVPWNWHIRQMAEVVSRSKDGRQ